MSLFLRGTLVLVVTAFLGECLEFVINMILARELGEAGLGKYMSILPTIFLVVIIASFEFPISISKFTAERDEKYHRHMLFYVFRFVVVMTVLLMLAVSLLFAVTPLFEGYHSGIRWLILITIPIISFMSIMRGYFMGLQHMGKIAAGNLVRKALQLGLLIWVYQLFSFESKTAIFIALCTLIASEGLIFLYFLHAYILELKGRRKNVHAALSKKEVRNALLSVSIPTTVLRIFHALTHAIQPFIIKIALVHAGMNEVMANEHFGVLAGIALTIGFFPAFIAYSLLVVLIPNVSEKVSKGDKEGLIALLRQVMWITLGYGVPAVTVFYFWGEPLTELFFHTTTAAYYLKLLWPYFLFHFFVMPMQAFLIGLGLVKDALLHTIWSTLLSFSLLYFLGSNSEFGMNGVIIGMNMGAVLITLLHYVTICRELEMTPWFKRTIRQ
jgi:stage V sporulation protein B